MAADPAAAGTTLFSEDFSGYAKDAVPSGTVTTATGRVVYGDASVTYTSVDNGKNITKIYTEALASGTSPELLVGKSGGVFTVAGIPSGNAKEITVSFKQNAQKLTVSLAGNGYSTEYASPKPAAAGQITFDVTVADGADATFSIIMTSGSSNVRVDDILVTVKTAGEASQGGDDPQPVQHTYTVAGSSTDLFGTAWDPANAANDMVLQEDNTYKWEKADLTLAAGEIKFKVCEDHAWDVAYPASDYVLNIPEAGVYTITITYNPADNNAVNAVAQKTGSAVVIPTVAMHGNFSDGTNWADTENFAVAEGNETASLTLNLAAGDYEFGMRIGGSGNWTANGAAFTRENNSAVIEAGQGNITLDADAAGEYTFTWTYATNTLTVTYPEYVEPTYNFADGYYLIGLDMADWNMENMPAEGRLFAANPDNEGEYQLTITLAADQQFKVVSVQKDQIKAWYPDGMDNNFIVDAAHAGEKTVYFRPDGQGGQDWHYGCIYVAANEAPVVVELQAVSEATTWDFSKITANTGNALYNKEGIQLTDESTPSKNDEMVYANYSADFMTFAEGFDAATMAFKGEYPIRKNQYCQAGTLRFKTTVAGTITVKFSDTGSSASATAVKRYLVVNGEQTEYWTSRQNNGTEPYDAQLNVTSGEIAVPAGDVTITGSSAIVVSNVTFTPEAPAKFYVTGNAALVGQDKEWNPSAIKSEADTLELNLEAGVDYILKVAVNGTWEGENNVKGYNELTEKTAGLLDLGDDHNIGFKLNEAGIVKVIYKAAAEEQPELFKLEGNFYVAPKVAYYLIGDSAFVVDAGATADKAWTPDAIPSFKDTTVLNLKAGVDYIMRLSLEGTWENHRDFRHLTDTAAGLKELVDEYENHSIGFQLAEAGQVTVIYIPAAEEQPEVFKLIGNFYVAPAPDPTVAVMGSMNDWAEEIPFVLSDDKTYASLTVENIGADEYEFKFIINGEYRSNGYRFHRGFPGVAGITGNEDANMTFEADQDGEYTIQWFFANDSLAIIFPEYIEPAKEYYAKYAEEWAWKKLTEKEGLWLTDTIVYKGIGININDKADDENNMFYSNTVEEEGVRPIAGAEFDVNDTLLFSFNPADSVVTAIMVGKYVPQLPVVGLGANFNGWNWPTNLFVPAEDSLSASFTITLGVTDTIEFKIVSDGSWLSLNGEGESLYGLHRNWPKAEHVNLINDGRNFSLTTDVAGEYTFTWTYADSTLVVTFPAAPAQPKFKIAGSMTDWAPSIEVFEDSYTFENLAAGSYKFKVVGGDWIGFDALTAETRAAELYKDQDGNVCFVLAEAGNVTVTYTEEVFKVEGAFVPALVQLIGINGWTAETDAINMTPAEDHLSASVTLNLTGWWYEFKVLLEGAWLGKEHGDEGKYTIHNGWNHVEGLTYAGDNIVLSMGDGDIVPGSYTFTYEYATGQLTVTFPTPTALDEIMAAGKAVKIVRNGQILIIKGEKIFNAQGQLVK